MDSRLFALLRILPADCGLAAGKDKEAGAAIHCDKPVPKSSGTEETHRKRSGEMGLTGVCLHVLLEASWVNMCLQITKR